MKSRYALAVALAIATLLATGAARAAEKVTAKEAEAMVKKGVAFIKSSGRDKGSTGRPVPLLTRFALRHAGTKTH